MQDQELLRRFATNRNEDAFTELVHRHSPMVFGVGMRHLHNVQDAEEVLQNVFMELAQKAASVYMQGRPVAGWIHETARRKSFKMRDANIRWNEHRSLVKERSIPEEPIVTEITLQEALKVLDEELARLPEKLRAACVLCYLEGKTQDEAARQLGWRLWTFRKRLWRGRNLLGKYLKRRGVTLPAGLLITLLSEQAVSAAFSAELACAVVRAGVLSAANTAILPKGMLLTLMTKPIVTGAVLLALQAGVVAAGMFMYRGFSEEKQPVIPVSRIEGAEAGAGRLLKGRH
jgi:RNA polymerase sigma factor (sigma-70 family)